MYKRQGLHINAPHVVLYDKSLEGRNNLSCGANEEEYHFKGLDMERDVKDAEYHDFAKVYEGGICPKCGKKTVRISKGIDVYKRQSRMCTSLQQKSFL